jgi:hypothetical protein
MATGEHQPYLPTGNTQAQLDERERNRGLAEAQSLLGAVVAGGEGSRPQVTNNSLDESLQSFHNQMVASTDLIKATLQVVRSLQDGMLEMRSWRADFSAKIDNILAMQQNGHCSALDNRIHRITMRQRDGSWLCQPRFPRTVRMFLNLNGEFLLTHP